MKARVVKKGFYGKDGELSIGTIVNVREINSPKLEKVDEVDQDEEAKGDDAKGDGKVAEKATTTGASPAKKQGT